jgi:8-oxo-dGTP diphosphatase
VRNGHLLLVKRAIEPYLGCWDIPGGFLEANEPPGDGAIREVKEETGLKVELTELFGFYMGRYSHGDGGPPCLNIYFLGHVVGGIEQPGDDATELAWFAPSELPSGASARVDSEAIAFDHTHQVLDDWARRTMGKET